MDKPTVSSLWCDYVRIKFPRLSKKSRQEYRSVAQKFLRTLPDRPTAMDIADLFYKRLDNYAESYRNFGLCVLRQVARVGVDLYGDNEIAKAVACVPPLRKPPPKPRCPPRDLLKRALEYCDCELDELAVRLAGQTGLRKSEILGLKDEDYDAEVGILRVVRQRSAPHRKNRRPHVVDLTGMDRLTELIEFAIAHKSSLVSHNGRAYKKLRDYILPIGKDGMKGILRRLRRGFGADVDKYLPPGNGWHAFRHWGASELALHGASNLQVQAWLGDASPEAATWYVSFLRGGTTQNLRIDWERKGEQKEKEVVKSQKSNPRNRPNDCGGECQRACTTATLGGARLIWAHQESVNDKK